VVPSIVQPPVETTGVDEGVLSLFCEANVKLPIVWTKGGRTITSTQRRYDVVEYNDGRASQLRIDPLRRHDDDTFTCRLENPEDGSAVEASAPVNVIAGEKKYHVEQKRKEVRHFLRYFFKKYFKIIIP